MNQITQKVARRLSRRDALKVGAMTAALAALFGFGPRRQTASAQGCCPCTGECAQCYSFCYGCGTLCTIWCPDEDCHCNPPYAMARLDCLWTGPWCHALSC